MAVDIPHSKPTLGAEEYAAVGKVICSNDVAGLAELCLFETALETYLVPRHRRYAFRHICAVSSGLAALHLALEVLDADFDCDIVVPSLVCPALLHAIQLAGATPVIVDVDARTGNIDPASVEEVCVHRQPRAMIVPHMFGRPASMTPLLEIGIPIIEDCAHAIGADYNGRALGTIGEIGVYSFYATKMLCTGEGGAVLCNDVTTYNRLQRLRDYRLGSDSEYQARFNYCMTDMQAAMGRVQLQRLHDFIEIRRAIAVQYDLLLSGAPGLELPPQSESSVWYRYVVKVNRSQRDTIRTRMLKAGIHCGYGVRQPLHVIAPQWASNDCLNAGDWAARSLSLPIYPTLDAHSIERVADTLKSIVKELL